MQIRKKGMRMMAWGRGGVPQMCVYVYVCMHVLNMRTYLCACII